MTFESIRDGLLIIILTTISGLSDAQGVIHAANIWQQGALNGLELGKSALFFTVGISAYWIAIRFMKSLGIVSPEIQTVIWFGVMILGVALTSGAFFKWKLTEQVVGVAVLTGIVWLSVRTGG
jgi:hypothetical protein